MSRAILGWMGTTALGPALGWLIGSTLYPLQLWSWHWRLEARVLLAAILPIIAASILTLSMARARKLSLLPLLWIATLLVAYSARPAFDDLRSGPLTRTVHVVSTDVVGGNSRSFTAHVDGGDTFDYDDTIANGTFDGRSVSAMMLEHTGALLSIEGAKGKPLTAFNWLPLPLLFIAWLLPSIVAMRARRRTRFVAAGANPKDGRVWIRGRLPGSSGYREESDHPQSQSLTVYVTARSILDRYHRRILVQQPCFGWSPSQSTLETEEGAVEVDLSGAWYGLPPQMLSRDPPKPNPKPRFDEDLLSEEGFVAVDSNTDELKRASFNLPLAPGLKLFRKRFSHGASFEACGYLTNGKLSGAGRRRPLLVINGGEPDFRPFVMTRLIDISFGNEVWWWLASGFPGLGAFLYALTGVIGTRWPWL